MCFLLSYCFLCLNYNNLQIVRIEDNEEMLVQEKLKCCLPEILDTKPDIHRNICSNCLKILTSFYDFKQTCLRNNSKIKNYFQNKQLPFLGYDNQAQQNQKYLKAMSSETDNNNKNSCDIDTKDSKSDSKDDYKQIEHIDVKEELIEFDDNNFYSELVQNIKCEPDCQDEELKYESCNLSEHNIKKFQCMICKKKFKQRGHLLTHETSHTGVKKYQCTVCNKKFTQNSHLTEHKQTHENIKKYKCEICNKNYSLKKYLASHTKYIHTKTEHKQSFKCSVCLKIFKRKSTLKDHEKLHMAPEEFQCTICENKFLHKKNLSRHLKIHARCNNT